VLQKGPPQFFLQPHDLYPMSIGDFDYWVDVLKRNFPDHPILENLYTTWYPRGSRDLSRSYPTPPSTLRAVLRRLRMILPLG